MARGHAPAAPWCPQCDARPPFAGYTTLCTAQACPKRPPAGAHAPALRCSHCATRMVHDPDPAAPYFYCVSCGDIALAPPATRYRPSVVLSLAAAILLTLLAWLLA